MRVLITGGTNGMGKGVAKVLSTIDQNAHEIIILCRSKELGNSTLKELKKDTKNNKISYVLCDLSKLSDVKKVIEDIKSKYDFLDGIFINAGLGYAAKRIETEDGMDPHFQVNYLAQFMLTLNLLELLEKSKNGGRVIFNVTKGGQLYWDDLQMKHKWGYEMGVRQAMVAKRMFLLSLHYLYQKKKNATVSFIGFQISKTVWSNQLNIIPTSMRIMATIMKFLGTFISIEKCGEIMAPLFTENQEVSSNRSGQFFTWKNNQFVLIKEDINVLNKESQDRLWDISLKLCADEKTNQIVKSLF